MLDPRRVRSLIPRRLFSESEFALLAYVIQERCAQDEGSVAAAVISSHRRTRATRNSAPPMSGNQALMWRMVLETAIMERVNGQ